MTMLGVPRISAPPAEPRPPRRAGPSSGRGLVVSVLASVLVLGLVVVGLDYARTTPRWRQTFAEGFDTAVPVGSFPGPAYERRWSGYDEVEDTSGSGTYSPDDVLSVHDGLLDIYLHTRNGRPRGAALIPLVNGSWGGQVYGRFTVRFRSDSVPGYGAGWLLWPDSNRWAEGEMDFPEGGLDSTIYANQHCIGDPQRKCLAVDTGVAFSSGWHTTTIEWTPAGVSYLLDGAVVASTTESPSTPFHLVLQTATNGEVPPTDAAGHVLIDSVTVSTLSQG